VEEDGNDGRRRDEKGKEGKGTRKEKRRRDERERRRKKWRRWCKCRYPFDAKELTVLEEELEEDNDESCFFHITISDPC